MQFFRVFQHLLPRAQAWRLASGTALRKFFEGLTTLPGDAKTFIDRVWEDAFPTTTRELAEWERFYGLQPNGDEAARRLALAAEWAATGGQSPSYIEGVLRTAGFDVYVHEWWSSFPPYVARDPRTVTAQPLIGTVQCTGPEHAAAQSQCTPPFGADGAPFEQPLCNRFLVNDPGYFDNENLTPRAPPPIPNDPARWPYFVYVCAQTWGTPAIVPASRRPELKRLCQKLKPAQHWVVLLVTEGNLITEAGDPIITEGGDTLVV
jgi:hypothetical protein